MIRLLRIEFLKVKNYRTFWWILGIYAVLVPLIYSGLGNLDNQLLPTKTLLYTFPTIWHFVTWTASWFNVLLGVLIVIMVCNDIAYKTQRQSVIDGLSRSEMILAKILFLIVLAFAVTLYTFLIGAVVGCTYSTPSNILNGTEYLPIYFVQTVGYFAFAFFFAVLIRKPALAVILFIMIIAIDIFLYIPWVLDHRAQYFPTIAISELTPNPFYEKWILGQKMANPGYVEPPNMDQLTRSIVASIYIIGFFIAGYFSVKKRDL